MSCTVGATVRVSLPPSAASRRKKAELRTATICVCDTESDQVEVLLEKGPGLLGGGNAGRRSIVSGGDEEEDLEVVVPARDVSGLLDFELAQTQDWDTSAEDEKVNVNIGASVRRAQKQAAELARLRDFRAARSRLVRAVFALASDKVEYLSNNSIHLKMSVGLTAVVCSCVYSDEGLMAPVEGPGMVSSIETSDGTAEIMVEGIADDLIVTTASLVPVASDKPSALALCKVLIDLTRYALQQEPPALAHAAESGSIAAFLAQCLMQDSLACRLEDPPGWEKPSGFIAEAEQNRFDALMLLTRSQVLQCRFKAASGNLRAAIELRPGDSKAREMVGIIKSRHKYEEAQNRALAKSVSRWVGQAMRKNEEIQQQQQQQQIGQGQEQQDEEQEPESLIGWVKNKFLG